MLLVVAVAFFAVFEMAVVLGTLLDVAVVLPALFHMRVVPLVFPDRAAVHLATVEIAVVLLELFYMTVVPIAMIGTAVVLLANADFLIGILHAIVQLVVPGHLLVVLFPQRSLVAALLVTTDSVVLVDLKDLLEDFLGELVAEVHLDTSLLVHLDDFVVQIELKFQLVLIAMISLAPLLQLTDLAVLLD